MSKARTKSKPKRKRAKKSGGGMGGAIGAACSGLRVFASGLIGNAYRIGVSAVGLALIAAWALGIQPLRDRAGEIRSMEAAVEIEWVWSPASGDAVADLRSRVDEMLRDEVSAIAGRDPYDHASLERAADRLVESGWFERVEEVRRLGDRGIRVRGVERMPWAFVIENVQRSSRVHLVSASGVPLELPVGVSVDGLRNSLFTIVNPGRGPALTGDLRVDRSRPWPGGGVAAANELIRFLGGLDAERLGMIEVIDLRTYADDGFLRIVTDRGGELVWGMAVGRSPVQHADDEQRLANLERALTPGDRLDRSGHSLGLYAPTLMQDLRMRPGSSR